LASNPKLAALFDNFLSDDDEEEDAFENVDTENLKVDEPIDEDAPLFLSKTQGLINDMSAYVYDDDDDDEAMNQAISRMYSTESGSHAVAQEDKASHLSLNPDEFYEFWVSRAPDAFMYMHSFNDEYKKILKRAIEEQDPDKIKSDLLSIRKQFGKTNEANELALETLQFKQDFLESVIEWRAKQAIENEGAFEQIDDKPAPPVELTEDTIMIDDDDDDEEIQFTTGLKQGMVISDDRVQSTESILEKEINYREKEASSPSKEHVHIDIHQSTLPLDNALDNNQALVNNDVEELELADKTNGQKTDLPKSNDEGSSKLQSRDDIENKMITESSTIVDFEKEKMDEPTTTTKDHGYNSEEELDVQGEEDEFARFVSDIQSKHLDQVRTELYQDMKDLNKQQRKEMGNSDDVTDQMVQDIQELLKLFGVPYIVSPMEAEAQCAALETLTLVDGTITDDSDVFLFGASRVFKNMFNQQRFVECYMSQDIEREMSLSRKKLIQLAFLLGSDYTEGIPGVGPVAAMEILAEFGSEEEEEEEALQAPLERFKNWYNSGIDTSPFQKKFVKYTYSLSFHETNMTAYIEKKT
jgi:DNA excision repair protein ERCC-5